MKDLSKKEILIVLVIVIVISAAVFFDLDILSREKVELIEEDIVSTEKRPEITIAGKKIEYINNSTRDSILADIQETGGEGYEKYSIRVGGPNNYIMLAYKPLFSEDNFGGIVVIETQKDKEPQIVWETTSILFGDRKTKFEVRDINEDGVNEILSWWLTNIYESLFVFTFDGAKYILLNPMRNIYENFPGGKDEIITGIDLNAYSPDFNIGENEFSGGYALGGLKVLVKDVDDDYVEEVLVENLNVIESDPNLAGPEQLKIIASEKLTKIYKWDGNEYYLWKEEREKIK